MRVLLFSIFYCVALGISGAFAGQVTSCGEPDEYNNCGPGCYYSGDLKKCEACPPGTYNDGTVASCNECTRPNGAEWVESTGYTTDSCPWTLTCAEGGYFDDTDDNTFRAGCVKCEDKIDALGQDHYVKIEGIGDCTVSGEGSFVEETNCLFNNRCTGRVYQITLNKNTNLERMTVQSNEYEYTDKTLFYKHNAGFSTEQDAGTWGFTLPESLLMPSNILKEFNGYSLSEKSCVAGYKVFDETGAGVPGAAAGNFFFNPPSNLYACWNNHDVIVNYYNTLNDTVAFSWYCAVNDDNNTFSCIAQSFNQSTGGGFVDLYQCYYFADDGMQISCGQVKVGAEIPIMSTEMYLKPQVTPCQAGYYCASGGRKQCPAGMTSDEGSDSIFDCHMVLGDNGTKFCDKNGCFTLPGSGIIPYNP